MANEFNPEVAALVRQPYPTTVLDVIERMADLQDAMGGWHSPKPLAAFNFLYHAITSSVAHRLGDLDAPALENVRGGRAGNPLFKYFEQAIDVLASTEICLGPPGLEDVGHRPPRRNETDVHPRYADLATRMERGFADPDFMRTLDVQFAECYFRALRGWVDGARVPRAWEVLFDNWDDVRTEGPFSGALLGVNAHINHDLAIAVLNAHAVHDRPIERHTVLYDDYLLINDIFEVQTPLLHGHLVERLESPKFVWWSIIGQAGLEEVAQFILRETREWAWAEAENMQTGATASPVGDPSFINPTTDGTVGIVAEQLLAMYL